MKVRLEKDLDGACGFGVFQDRGILIFAFWRWALVFERAR